MTIGIVEEIVITRVVIFFGVLFLATIVIPRFCTPFTPISTDKVSILIP